MGHSSVGVYKGKETARFQLDDQGFEAFAPSASPAYVRDLIAVLQAHAGSVVEADVHTAGVFSLVRICI